jgi:hypothetical protein
MAIPGPDLDRFLQKNLAGYQPDAPARAKLSWDQVDKQVSPSVLLVVNRRLNE